MKGNDPLPKSDNKRTKRPAAKKTAGKKPAAKKSVAKESARQSAKAMAKASVKPSPKATAPAKKPDVDRSAAEATLKLVLAKLDDIKAENSVIIDLAGKSSIGDFMVVTTGRSNTHVGAIAETVTRALKTAGMNSPRVEGLRQGDWVLIDAGDVIVHVFRPEVREFYGLEKMWSV